MSEDKEITTILINNKQNETPNRPKIINNQSDKSSDDDKLQTGDIFRIEETVNINLIGIKTYSIQFQ